MFEDPISWYVHASGSAQAEAWVGLGTILLAVATSVAVYISLRQNGQENVRFEQGYAPILTVDHFQSQGSLFYEIHVLNIGYGPALKAKLRIEGTRVKNHYKVVIGRLQSFSDPQPIEKTEHLPFLIEQTDAFLMNGDRWGFYIPDYAAKNEAYEKNGLEISEASIVYYDRFGNEYRTEYSDFVNRQYDWIPPKRFRKKGKKIGDEIQTPPNASPRVSLADTPPDDLDPGLRG